MASSKHMKSDSSSEESDQYHQEQVKDDSTGSTKRSYECTYCKRGFTNAQALGGHMNIHRKDRAKAKQHQHANSSVSKAPNEDNMSPMSYSDPIWGVQATCYWDPEAQINNCMYPPPIFPSPPSQADCYRNDLSAPRSGIHTPYEEGDGANLSLKIGSTYEHREVMRGDDQEKDGVDLELRLGRDP